MFYFQTEFPLHCQDSAADEYPCKRLKKCITLKGILNKYLSCQLTQHPTFTPEDARSGTALGRNHTLKLIPIAS